MCTSQQTIIYAIKYFLTLKYKELLLILILILWLKIVIFLFYISFLIGLFPFSEAKLAACSTLEWT